MRRRRHGDRLAQRVEAVRPRQGEQAGKARAQSLRRDRSQIKVDTLGIRARHLLPDRAGNDVARGQLGTGGWNWMNSRSISAAPAREARAMPSPVATVGFVV